jgi:cell division septation protein DedD
MRLTFPNGEHPDVVEPSRVTLGSGGDSRVRLDGLSERHAVLANDRRGLWLVIESGDAVAHVNARPVKRLALVRPGDLITLGDVQIQLRSEFDPKPTQLPPAGASSDRADNGAVCAERFVLRGVGGAHYGRSFPLCRPVVVGRGESATLRLEEPAMAESQARVELHGDSVVLRDLGKGDGTVLNGVPVHNAVLTAGDQLAWEQNRYVLEAPGLSAPVQRHDTTPLPKTSHPTTQTMRPVTAAQASAKTAPKMTPVEALPARNAGAWWLWWLIAAAALLGAAIAALLLFGPRIG